MLTLKRRVNGERCRERETRTESGGEREKEMYLNIQRRIPTCSQGFAVIFFRPLLWNIDSFSPHCDRGPRLHLNLLWWNNLPFLPQLCEIFITVIGAFADTQVNVIFLLLLIPVVQMLCSGSKARSFLDFSFQLWRSSLFLIAGVVSPVVWGEGLRIIAAVGRGWGWVASSCALKVKEISPVLLRVRLQWGWQKQTMKMCSCLLVPVC